MSSTNPPTERKEDGLGRFVKRMKTVFKKVRSKTSKKKTTTTTAPTATTSEPLTTTPAPAAEPTAAQQPGRERDYRSFAQREKAQALFAKYGLELRDDEWIFSSVTPVEKMERVEKPIRMRVRRQCHKCQTTFGADKICASCEHHRCKDCPRIPPKKNRNKGKAGIAAAAADAEKAKATRKGDATSTSPDPVTKPVKQRTRRYCHKCGSIFSRNAPECAQCQHVRCKRCPRDPPKEKKHPEGYPGDAEPESDDGDKPKPTDAPKEEEKENEPTVVKEVTDKISNLGIQGDEPGGPS